MRRALHGLSVSLLLAVACGSENEVPSPPREPSVLPAPPPGHAPQGTPPGRPPPAPGPPNGPGNLVPIIEPNDCPPLDMAVPQQAIDWVRAQLFTTPAVDHATYQQRLDTLFEQMALALQQGDLCAYDELSGPLEIYALRCTHAQQGDPTLNLEVAQRWWERERTLPLREVWLSALLEPERVCDDAWTSHVGSMLDAIECDSPPEVVERIAAAVEGATIASAMRHETLAAWLAGHRQRCPAPSPGHLME